MTDRLRVWRKPITGRDPEEAHRASTPLELFFDLCFVVAVSQVALELHHGLAAGHAGSSVARFLMLFFAIWWAWLNFTWFASAYDVDDVPYRILTFVSIAGALVIAAGVPAAFEHADFRAPVIGYVIMRVALVAQWLRVAYEDAGSRTVGLRYAAGVTFVQVLWVVWLALPLRSPADTVGFLVLVVVDCLVPYWAERAWANPGGYTPWHPEHIAERYGLFTLIVLGEGVLGATTAVQTGLSESGLSAGLVEVAVGGLLLVFGAWWVYFKRPSAEGLRDRPEWGFPWGYAHYLVFGAAAALGAGLALAAEVAAPHGEWFAYAPLNEPAPEVMHGLGPVAAALAVAVPVAVYLVVVAGLQTTVSKSSPVLARASVTAVLVLAAALLASSLTLPGAVLAMGLLVTALIASDVLTASRRARTRIAAGTPVHEAQRDAWEGR